jgi:CheY-like chemotaxis protein
MSTEEKPQVSKEPQQTSSKETQETPSECYQETLLKESEERLEKIKSESAGCDGADPHKWDNKMEVQRFISGKPDLEVEEKRTVLFVDDDRAMLRSIERCLLDGPCNQLFAMSGEEALKILQKEEVHVIVTDMLMPDIGGLELSKFVKIMYPHIVRIVMSGYEDQDSVQQAIEQGIIVNFINKAWNNKENFKEIIMEAIDRYNSQSECNTARQ